MIFCSQSASRLALCNSGEVPTQPHRLLSYDDVRPHDLSKCNAGGTSQEFITIIQLVTLACVAQKFFGIAVWHYPTELCLHHMRASVNISPAMYVIGVDGILGKLFAQWVVEWHLLYWRGCRSLSGGAF